MPRIPGQSIPSAASMTPQWLSDCLQRAGHHATVESFTKEPIGTGQIGACFRLRLELADGDAEPEVPRTLVAKFASADPTSRSTGVQLWNFLKEVRFYQELQQCVAIRTPRCYFAEIEGEGPECALLLEDLSPARQGDQLAGCSVDVARAAVAELVGLHAPTWCNEAVQAKSWLGPPPIAGPEKIQALYAQCLPGFVKRYGTQLEAEQIAIIERLGSAPGAWARGDEDVFAAIHVDYRLDNLLIHEEPGKAPVVTAVDWQSVQLGSPLSDVAYFLGAGLAPELRRSSEPEIVRRYHEALLEALAAAREEPPAYSWERCWSDYRRGAFAGFSVTVVASMMVEQTARGDEMFLTMARRHSTHALDLEADEFLAAAG